MINLIALVRPERTGLQELRQFVVVIHKSGSLVEEAELLCELGVLRGLGEKSPLLKRGLRFPRKGSHKARKGHKEHKPSTPLF